MIKFQTLAEPISILIVDDNEADILILKETLKEEKLYVNIESAWNGEEALSYLRKEPPKYKDAKTPSLILLDLRMPRMDGHELLKIIKNDEKLKHIPVIIMTISALEEDVLKSYDEHANAYVIKPINFNQFVTAIRSLEYFWLTIVKLPTT